MRRDGSDSGGPPVLWGGLSMMGCLMVGMIGAAGLLGAAVMLLVVVIVQVGTGP